MQKAIPERVETNQANIARIVHIELCHKFGLVGEVRLYNNKPETLAENNRVKIL